MNDFVKKYNIKVQYDTTIENIGRRDETDNRFHVNDQHSNKYTCDHIIVATGIAKPNLPENEGCVVSHIYVIADADFILHM